MLCKRRRRRPPARLWIEACLGKPILMPCLKAMTIAAKAIGSSKGYIYCRAEYPLAIRRLSIAIAQAKEYGLLGENILDTGFNFDIEIYHGRRCLRLRRRNGTDDIDRGQARYASSPPPLPRGGRPLAKTKHSKQCRDISQCGGRSFTREANGSPP